MAKKKEKQSNTVSSDNPKSIFNLKAVSKKNSISFRSFSKSEELMENLAIMLNSGLDIATSLEIIITNEKSNNNRSKLEEVLEGVSSGSYLWESLDNLEILPARFINIIKIGEESGTLLDNLNIIVEQQKKENELKSKIRAAMTYPAIVLLMALVVGLAMSLFILPRIANVYAGFNTELPKLTQFVISAGLFLDQYGMIVIPSILFLMIMTVYILFVNPTTKIVGEKLLLITPFVNTMIKQREMLRMGYIVGNMLKYGTPIDKAIASLCEIDTYQVFRNSYLTMKDSITAGNSFEVFFEREGANSIPRDVKEMILISERSGKLPQSFINIGILYEKKFNNTSQSFFVILEPLLLISVWVVVALLAFAVITPIYSLIGSL